MTTTRQKNRRTGIWTPAAALLATILGALVLPGQAAAEPQGYIEDEVGVGFFYGTFNESPNIVLLVGGRAEDFCDDNPGDPFNAEPGSTTQRTFLRKYGAVDIKVNDKDQPIHLYESDLPDAPTWIEQVCEGYFDGSPAPEPFASGTADLKVRISVVSETLIDVFNSVNGTAIGTDGTRYRVRASADLVVRNGVPVGDPEDFVSFSLRQVGR